MCSWTTKRLRQTAEEVCHKHRRVDAASDSPLNHLLNTSADHDIWKINWNYFVGRKSQNFGEYVVLPSGIISNDESYFFHWWIKNLLCTPYVFDISRTFYILLTHQFPWGVFWLRLQGGLIVSNYRYQGLCTALIYVWYISNYNGLDVYNSFGSTSYDMWLP